MADTMVALFAPTMPASTFSMQDVSDSPFGRKLLSAQEANPNIVVGRHSYYAAGTTITASMTALAICSRIAVMSTRW